MFTKSMLTYIIFVLKLKKLLDLAECVQKTNSEKKNFFLSVNKKILFSIVSM